MRTSANHHLGVIELIDIPIEQLAQAMWDSSREAGAAR